MKDLRQFLAELDKAGELNVVDSEVDWDLQAAALCSMTNRVGGPAVHFRKVKGSYGSSMAGSLFTGPGTLRRNRSGRTPWRRMAIAMGLDVNIDYETFMQTALGRRRAPIKPIQVSGGPCKDVVIAGGDVDLMRFPWPMLHASDGGRYSTCHTIIVKDLDTVWQNWGMNRLMIAERDRMVCHFQPTRYQGFEFAKIYAKYASRGQPMPVCVVVGGEPVNQIVSALTLFPPGQDEAAIAGGLQAAPVELTKAELSDILVPANAEIVIEGEIVPGDMADEGPFPSYFSVSPKQPGLVLRVKAITHRKDPILTFIAEGAQVSDSVALMAITSSMELWSFCLSKQFPIRWLYLPVETLLGLCVVSAPQPYAGAFWHLTSGLWSHPLGHLFDKILVVDTDVAGADLGPAFADWFIRASPTSSWHIVGGDAPLGPAAAYATEEDLAKGVTTRVWIDATIPPAWDAAERPRRVSFEDSFPLEIQERVVRRWEEEFGLSEKPIWKRAPSPQA